MFGMFGRMTQEKTALHATTLPSLLSETVGTDVGPRIWRGHRRPVAVGVTHHRIIVAKRFVAVSHSQSPWMRLNVSHALTAR